MPKFTSTKVLWVPGPPPIYVKWMLDKRLLIHPTIAPKNKMALRLRFLDDLWFVWRGTERQFENFKRALNDIGSNDTFTLKGEVGSEVEFLDVKLTLTDETLETSVFIKPTDSKHYLNRRSDHSRHVFKGIPYSQYRRAVVICSSTAEREKSIDYMEGKFLASGYKASELQVCREKALELNREQILAEHKTGRKSRSDENILTYVINHDPDMAKALRTFLESKKDELERIIGNRKIVISERRSPNTASLLFAKSGFSSPQSTPSNDQRCNARGCLLCDNLTSRKIVNINDLRIKFDFNLDCKSTNCIYLAICRHCTDRTEFYIGQTTTAVHTRFNGHRSCFKVENLKFNDSALSHHIYNKHVEHFPDKLRNFDIGIIRMCSADLLNRLEDYFIYSTKADIISLNRYKVVN